MYGGAAAMPKKKKNRKRLRMESDAKKGKKDASPERPGVKRIEIKGTAPLEDYKLPTTPTKSPTSATKKSPKQKKGGFRGCAISLDGRRAMATAEDETDIVGVWELDTGREATQLVGHTKPIVCMALSRDGRRALTCAEDLTCRLWELHSGRELLQLTGHTKPVRNCKISFDGTRALTCSDDGTCRIWLLQTGRELMTISGHRGAVTACSISKDNMRGLTCSTDRTCLVWALHSGAQQIRKLSGHKGGVLGCSISMNGKRALTCSEDRSLRYWELDTGKTTLKLEGHSGPVTECWLITDNSARLSRGFSSSLDMTCRLWELDNGTTLVVLEGHTAPIANCALSADARRAVTTSADLTRRVWELDTGKQMLALKGGNSLLRKRAEASDLLALLRKPHRFHHGDDVSNLTGGGVSAAKLIKIGLMLGMTVPVPGFALVGGLAGAVLASPQVQAIVVRFIVNNTDQSLTMTNPPGSEDLQFELTLGKGAAFVPSATYSLDKGDWLLSEPEEGDEGGEKLTMWERLELTTGKVGVVENTWHMQPFKDDPPPEEKGGRNLKSFGRRTDDSKKRDADKQKRSPSPVAPAIPVEGMELVCTSKIRTGQQILVTTVRTYRTVNLDEEEEEMEEEAEEDDEANPLLRVKFEEEGPLGILWRNVVRTTDDAQLAIAEKISPDSQASEKKLKPGLILTQVNGVRTTGVLFDDQIKMIQKSGRPINMVFRKSSMYESIDVPDPEPEPETELMSMSLSTSMSMSLNMNAGVGAEQNQTIPQLWVGNLPLNQATEEAVVEALTRALYENKIVAEGEETGIDHCTVRPKPDKTCGSWALIDFKELNAMYRTLALKTKVSLPDENGVMVVLNMKQSEM